MKNTDKKIISVRLIITIICLWIISIIFIDILKHGTWFLDYPIYNFISKFQSDGMTVISKILARVGGRAGLTVISVIASLICLIKYKNKKLAILIIINMMVIGTINLAIKNIIQRPRPSGIRMMEISGYSFPSGHSMGAMGLWGMLIILAYYWIKDPKKKILLIAIFSIIILSVGLSRIYLGVHYASDVLCGFLITTMYYCAVMPIIKRIVTNEKNAE